MPHLQVGVRAARPGLTVTSGTGIESGTTPPLAERQTQTPLTVFGGATSATAVTHSVLCCLCSRHLSQGTFFSH